MTHFGPKRARFRKTTFYFVDTMTSFKRQNENTGKVYSFELASATIRDALFEYDADVRMISFVLGLNRVHEVDCGFMKTHTF